MLLETDAGGAPLVSYTLANGQLISQVRDGLPSYYLTDGQGSVRALTDANGAISDTYAYTAFGELYAQTGGSENNYLYTGQQFDEVTGLYSLRARYYDPGLGRFLSQDTAGVLYGNPVELNRYVYTGNSPINHLDPSGNEALVGKAAIENSSVRNQSAISAIGLATARLKAYAVLAVLLVPVGVVLVDLIVTPIVDELVREKTGTYTLEELIEDLKKEGVYPSSESSPEPTEEPVTTQPPPPPRPKYPTPTPKPRINLDTGGAIALSTTGYPHSTALAAAAVQGHKMVMTTTAWLEFTLIVRDFAGPTETANAGLLLSRVQSIPDNPSTRVISLPTTKGMGLNDKIIFGTADRLGIVTLTTDEKFIRAAREHGVDLTMQTIVIPPAPFTGK